MSTYVEILIAKFGSQERLAKAAEATQSSVHDWKRSGRIPARRQELIFRNAGKFGLIVEPSEFWPGDADADAANREYEFIESQDLMGFEERDREIVYHRDLDVWKLSMKLAREIYRVTLVLPPEEKYGLTSQMRRAAVSIPANIAEGYGRETSGSYLQILRIAQGSARELETMIELAKEIGFLSGRDCDESEDYLRRVLMMLRRLIQSVSRRIPS